MVQRFGFDTVLGGRVELVRDSDGARAIVVVSTVVVSTDMEEE